MANNNTLTFYGDFAVNHKYPIKVEVNGPDNAYIYRL